MISIMVWLHALADGLIGISCALIPMGIARVAQRRKDLTTHWILWLFAAFILSCGTTHLLAVAAIFTPIGGLEGLLKAVTAGLSLATAALLFRRIPELGRLPSLSQWRRSLDELLLEINARKQAQEESVLLAAIVASSDDAIVSMTLDGFLTSWNAGAERLFGYGAEEALGRNIAFLVPPGDPGAAEQILRRLHEGVPVQRYETTRQRKDGRIVHVSLSMSPVRSPGGEIIGASKIFCDIGEKLRAQEKFRLVVESAPNAMVLIDRGGGIALVNTQAERMFGYPAGGMLGQPAQALVPERLRAQHRSYVDALLALPPTVDSREVRRGLEFFGLRKDGSEFPVQTGLNRLETDEGSMVLSAIVDMTEAKRTEETIRKFNNVLEERVAERTLQLAAANKDLEEFAYAASHDLKAPLRVIDNASRWLEEDLAEHLSGETRGNLDLLRGRVRRMDKLLDDLLEYARIGRAMDERYGEIVSGDALMQNVTELLAPDGFTIEVSAALAEIRVSRMPLQQILLNLTGNAIKHHHKRAGRVRVAVKDSGDFHEFSVEDDGPGIPSQFHEQIFKMFQTLRPRDQVEGSGMGLAMVRKNLEIFGGTIWLESKEGLGSLFRFTWPKLQRMRAKAA